MPPTRPTRRPACHRGPRPLRRPAGVAGLIALAIVTVAGCGGADDGNRSEELTVYVSAPLAGPAGPDGRDVAAGARLALAEAEGSAGRQRVRAVILDSVDRRDRGAGWTPARVGRNARRATRDASAIAYIGELSSGATRISLPITNAAQILQVSPAGAAEDLVREPGTFEGVPEAVQPSGERSFGRVIPGDSAQARAGAAWAMDLDAERSLVVGDGSQFSRTVGDAYAGEAIAAGVEVERAPLDPFLRALGPRPAAAGAAALCARARDRGLGPVPPGVIYFSGADGRAAAALGCRPRARAPLIATDAVLAEAGELAGLEPEHPILLTSAALDPVHLPPPGQRFVDRFRRALGREPGRHAAYGYEAMAVVLDAIERAGADGDRREAVIEAFFATAERDSVLGTYSIEATGETTLDRLSGYRLGPGGLRPIRELTAP